MLRTEQIGDTCVLNYRYDDNGTLLSVSSYNISSGATNILYAQTNTRGDVVALYDGNGDIRTVYTYDSWGKLISVTDGEGNALSANKLGSLNSIRYRGYVYDSETGLYYLQSRYYDPEVGRFLNADSVDYIPIMLIVKGIVNLYSYCWNNPISYEDPTGHLSWPGQVHNRVIEDILSNNPELKTQKRIYYNDGSGKYGYCDIINFTTMEIWEVKRCTLSYEAAQSQLNKYVNGYYQPKRGQKIDGFKRGGKIIDGQIPNYYNYYIWYWYEGRGIIFYDYRELSIRKAYEPSFSTVPDTVASANTFYAIILFMLGVLSMFGGRSVKYA